MSDERTGEIRDRAGAEAASRLQVNAVLLAAGLLLALLGLWLLVRPLLPPQTHSLIALPLLPAPLRALALLAAGAVLGVYAWRRGRPPVILVPPRPETQPVSPGLPPVSTGAPSLAFPRPAEGDGPKIVAIGGGTGMPQLLRGLRAYTDHITALVTVADDGGSSGRLRRQMGMLPPGDFRNNMAALSEAEELMTRLFQYRFAEREITANGQPVRGELAGHSFGNLFITTMAAVTGSFEAGIAESSRVLAVRGRILPSTLEHVTLCAEICRLGADGQEEWSVVEGESSIPAGGGRIMRVYLKPENARAFPAVIQAILQADLIVAGPGSFYTSVIPNLLVPAVGAAIRAAPAARVYVCNVATQAGETDHYSVSDHMRQLRLHAGSAFDVVLANDRYDPAHPPSPNSQWVSLPPPDEPLDYRLFVGDVVDTQQPWRHDPHKLAAALMNVLAEMRPASGGAVDRSNAPTF